MKDNARRLTELQLRAEAGLITQAQSDELVHLLLSDEDAFEDYVTDLHLQASLTWRLSGLQQSSDFFDAELVGADAEALAPAEDTSAWDMVVDQALALRRQHEVEDEANRQLAAQQAEDARNRRFELRRLTEPPPATRTFVIPQLVVWLGFAAVLGIVAWGLHVFTPPPAALPPTAQNAPTSTPDHSAHPVAPTIAVATLTAQHDARWSSTVLSTGDELVAGQTLTLTHGFAEVTTRRGAIAILEAPCTVEFIDNDNALRLHAGKLVGVCEPESSKGFLVRTPHMDIIDLGTRFGINAARHVATDIHVFEGEVEVAMQANHNRASIQERLGAGHAVRAMSRADNFVAIDDDRSRFASLITIADTILPRGATEAGIAAMSGEVVWSPSSDYLGIEWTQWPMGAKAHVFEELPEYRLEADVPVSLLGPGSSKDMGQTLPTRTIPSGTTVRTYMVVLLPGVQGGPVVTPRGSITFEGEVIGIATHVSQDRVLKDLVGDPARLAPVRNTAGSWVDIRQGIGNQDEVALEDDGRTVTFAFAGSGLATDAVRVFVRVPEE